MKIILLLPQFKTHIITPPLGLGYLAASLKNSGHEVILLDYNLKNISPERFSLILKRERPNLVGINAMTPYYIESLKYLKEAKKQNILVCLGGPHISALPQQTLAESGADFIIIGEGDKTIVSLVNAISKDKQNQFKELSKIKGIGYKHRNKIIINPQADLIEDLDSLPIPSWELIKPQNYPLAPHGAFVKRFPVAPIITTRGCPFNCKFCASKCTWRQKLRFRNPKKIVDEIEMLNKQFKVKEFHFEDDNFTANREHAMEVCKEIIRRKLNIVWACPNGVRIDTLDLKLLKVMKKSGCYLLAFGIETGSQTIADNMAKHLDLAKVPGILNLIKEAGIETWGFFIIGLPGETYSSAIKTINFATQNKFDRAQFCIFTPLPGSEIFEKWENKAKEEDWSKFNFFNIVYTEGLSEKQLRLLHKKAFKSFYFRPKIMFNLFKNIKMGQIKWLIKRAIDYKFLKK